MLSLRGIRVLVAAAACLPLLFTEAATAAPPECEPLAFATVGAAGSVLPGDGDDCWQFPGVAGDRVRVRLVRTGGVGFSPRVEVVRPGGTTVCGSTSVSEFTCVLDVTGTYTILVRDASGTYGGEYKLSIQRLNNPVGCAALGYATTGSAGSIAPAEETDCWRFAGAAGDRARVRMVRTGGVGFSPRVEVVRPNGTTVCGSTSVSEFACLLDVTGTHTILVRDAAGIYPGDYKLSIQRLNDPVGCAALAFATTAASGSIVPADETDCWRFAGAAGDRVRVRMIRTGGSGFSARVEVLRPNGTTVCGSTSVSEFTCALDVTGTHTILIRDAAGIYPGEYKLSIQRLNNPVGCAALGYATAAAGSIAPADEIDCWRFAGVAGDRVRVRLVRTGGAGSFSPRVEVVRPNGTTVCGSTSVSEFTCVLDVTGTHTILVRDAAGINAGCYSLSIHLDPPGSRIVLEGEGGTGDGQVMPRSAASGFKTVWLHAGESRRFAFALPAGDRYRVNVRYSNDNFGLREVVSASIDGASVGQFEAQDTGDRGAGWNVFAEADAGSVALAGGAQELSLTVSGGDGYGIEIDSVTLIRDPTAL